MNLARKLVIGLVCLLILGLAACSDQATPGSTTSNLNPDPTPTAAPNAASEISPTPVTTSEPLIKPSLTPATLPLVVTPTPNLDSNSDDMSTLIPAITINPDLTAKPASTTLIAATPTFSFGSLTTPPPTLSLATANPVSATTVLEHNGLVVATGSGLYWLSVDGKNQRQIVGGTRYSQPKVSPDGIHIAVLRSEPISRKVRLYLVTADGKEQPTLESPDDLVTLNAVWSPDSKTLALTRVVDSNGDGSADSNDDPTIWFYNLENQKLQQVAAGRDPVWSPDGGRIAYIVPGPTSFQIDPATHQSTLSANSIAVYNLQQEAKRTLISSAGLQYAVKGTTADTALATQKATVRYFKQLNWSPDGKLIGASADGVISESRRIGLLFTLSLDNPTPQLLTTGNQAMDNFSWSPDGKRLVFEGLPQFPVTAQSSRNLGLVNLLITLGPVITKTFVGEAVLRSEASQPRWIMGGQALAFMEGDFASLAIVGSEGQDQQLLVSGCLGFDWVQ